MERKDDSERKFLKMIKFFLSFYCIHMTAALCCYRVVYTVRFFFSLTRPPNGLKGKIKIAFDLPVDYRKISLASETRAKIKNY